MSPVEILLIIWASLTLLSILVGSISVFSRTKKLKRLSLVEFINIAINSAAMVSSGSLLYRVLTSEKLLKLLQFDVYVLILGAIALIWLAIQQIWQIFK